MGIQGLLPFLKKCSRPVSLAEFKGQTAVVDVYGWLHKGAFSCAEKLVKGEPTDGYLLYVMKQVNLLLSFNIKPILVFDGCHLPAKEVTELKRRENRTNNRRKAKELLREGKIKEARECFQRCVDITSSMAHEVIKACRARNIDTIVAPYEADSQLAFFSHSGVADIVITEDSDLVLFGCKKIIFKIDSNGGGVLVENDKLYLAMNLPRDKFDFNKFRNMCILSGCDYLPSLHGIGLAKACRFFIVTSNPDVFYALCKLPSNLKMPNLDVTLEYRKGFMRAIDTLLHQLVFDPFTRTLKPLTPHPDGVSPEDMPYCGSFMGHQKGLQIAFGNVDVQTGETVDNYDPRTSKRPEIKSSGWHNKINVVSTLPSIWDVNYLERKEALLQVEEVKKSDSGIMMKGKEKVVPVPLKRKRPEINEKICISEDYLQSVYSNKKQKIEAEDESEIEHKHETADQKVKIEIEDNLIDPILSPKSESKDRIEMRKSFSFTETDNTSLEPLEEEESCLKIDEGIDEYHCPETESKPDLNLVKESPTKNKTDEDIPPKIVSRNPFAKKTSATEIKEKVSIKGLKFSSLTKFASSPKPSKIVCSKYFKPAGIDSKSSQDADKKPKSIFDLAEEEEDGGVSTSDHQMKSKENEETETERDPRIKSPLKPNNDLPSIPTEMRHKKTPSRPDGRKGSFNWGGSLSKRYSFEKKEKNESPKEQFIKKNFQNSYCEPSLDTPPSSQQGEEIEELNSGVQATTLSRLSPEQEHLTPPDDDSTSFDTVKRQNLSSFSRVESRQSKKRTLPITPKCRVSGLRKSSTSKQKQLNLKDMFSFKKNNR